MNRNDEERLGRFLKEIGLDAGLIPFEEHCRAFVDEMREGLAGRPSSLMMIPTFIDMEHMKVPRKPVVAVDAGGTRLRRALITFDGGRPVLEAYDCIEMPGSVQEVGKHAFYTQIAAFLSPLLPLSTRVGLCFSYALNPLPDGEAEVAAVGKSLRVEGLVGDRVAEQVLRACGEMGLPTGRRVHVVNDAVSTMLSGLAGPETFDGCIGFILGTGVNTCYLERKERITKHFGAGEKGSVPVNMETGGYDRFPQSAADEIYGKTVRTTFRNPFERMVSGKYQGGLFLTLLRMAAENALFSHAMQERLAELHELKAADLDVFLLQPQGEGVLARLCATEADREMVRGLIDALAQRTAKLTAISLTAVILHAGFGAKAGCPVKIVAEGSVFYRFRPYAEKLRAYMQAELDGVYHRSYTFAKVEHASLLGAGIAGLL